MKALDMVTNDVQKSSRSDMLKYARELRQLSAGGARAPSGGVRRREAPLHGPAKFRLGDLHHQRVDVVKNKI